MSPSLVEPGGSHHSRRGPVADGGLPPPGLLARTLAKGVLLPASLWFVVVVSAGWLLANPLKTAVSGEDRLNRWFAAHRTPTWNDVTNVLSMIGNTGTIVITTAAASLIYWLLSRRLREVVALVTGVATQAFFFLLTTLLVDRERPDVPKLDESPPTSSFPSGHTGASSALYFGLVILCVTRLRSRPLRVAAVIGFGIVPFLVLTSRMYRGMHHPSDVTFGVLNGLVGSTLAHRAMREAPEREAV